MKIKMLTNTYGPNRNRERNKIYEVSENEAAELVNGKYAEYIDKPIDKPVKKEVVKETASVSKKKETTAI